MHVSAIGVDTETVKGEPLSFQFFSKALGISDLIFLKSGKDATRTFFAWLDTLPASKDSHYVMFGHNLAFDMVSIFWDRHARLRNETVKGETWYGWRVEIVYAAVRFAVFRKRGRSVTLIDTGAYFVTKLEKLAEIFCPDLLKLNAPEGLGQRRFTLKDKHFCAYAMRDAEIAYYVGLFLLDRHREWDVSICVSAPHFASKVFRKHFLKKTIPLPPRKIIYAAMASYHGGKNNLTVSPGEYKRVYALDIKSAYPFAMSGFPSFSNADLYKALRGSGNPNAPLPAYGIYKITGSAKKCKWPALFSHNFKPLVGDFRGVWVTGFEINEALRCREVTLTDTFGYYYDAEADPHSSPFSAYVREFYHRKETAKEKPQREFNKLLMNALYGKFIQTRKIDGMADITFDMDESKLLMDASVQAGGLFNPFIASLITGHTRAFIHRLEHDYKALHTSTDGIQTQKKPRGLKKYGAPGALGSVTQEAFGDCLILRNKLYLLYGRITRSDNSKTILRSTIYSGRKIIKYALHGFHSTVHVLEELWKTGTREYEYIKVNKLRESLRRNLAVNDFVSRSATLNIEEKGAQSLGSPTTKGNGNEQARRSEV